MSFLITFPAGGGSATYKDAVRVARDTQLALTGSTPLTVDGVTLADKDRVLLRGQTAGAENGIYVAAISGGSYILSRAKDADTDKEVLPNMLVPVAEGSTNVDKIFQLVTNAPIVVGSTSLVFTDVLVGIANKADRDLSNLSTPTAINQNLIFSKTQASIIADNTQITKTNATLTVRAGNGIAGQRGNLNLYVCSNNTQYPLQAAGITVNADATPVANDMATDFEFSAGTGRFFKLKVDAGNVGNKAEMWQGGQKFLDVLHNGTDVYQIDILTNNATKFRIDLTKAAFFTPVQLNSGLQVKSVHAQVGTANVITVSVSDYYIGVDCSGAAKTVNLPAAATAGAGKTYVIKDETGSASTNNITVDANSAELIDGAATYVMAVNRESVTLVCDGTGWQII